jgi:hypothetical protein
VEVKYKMLELCERKVKIKVPLVGLKHIGSLINTGSIENTIGSCYCVWVASTLIIKLHLGRI